MKFRFGRNRLLEEENKKLKEQLARFEADRFRYDYLGEIMKRNKEVVFIIGTDGNGAVEYVSDSISAYGYTPEEFTSGKRSFLDMVHPDDHAELQKTVEKNQTNTSRVFVSDYRIYDKTGQLFWVTGSAFPIVDSSGKVKHHIAKITNISKRKEYEEELLDINENLSATLKSIGESVILLDAKGYINQLNATAEKLIGVINLKARNKHVSELITFSFLSDFSSLVNPLQIDFERRRLIQIDEIYMKSSYNKQYKVSCNISPIYVQKNRLTGYVMVVKDLTSVYETLSAVQESEQLLKSRLELLLSGNINDINIRLTDIIPIERLQTIQDKFSEANRVDSVITDMEGNPVTRPSMIGETGRQEDTAHVFEAKSPLYIGDRHVADWKISVCDFIDLVPPVAKTLYAGLSEAMNLSLRREAEKHFDNIYHLLEVTANEISDIGYNNVKLANELIKGKENEKKLRKSENTMRSIFDNSADGILLTDKNGIIKEWSRGYEQLSGISKEEAIGKYIWDVIRILMSPDTYTKDEINRMHAELDMIIRKQKQTLLTRHIVNRKNRQEHITHAHYFPVQIPDGVMMGAIIRDVTEDIHTKEQLLTEKERLQALGDNFPNGCLFRFIFDTRTSRMDIAYLSKTWDMLCNIPREEALKDVSQAFSCIYPDDLPVYLEAVKESAATLSRFNIEVRYNPGDDSVRWIQISSQPRLEGKNIVCDGFMLDITDRKKAENELIAEKERLLALGDNLPNGCLIRFGMNMQTQEIRVLYISKPWEELSGGISTEALLEDPDIAFSKIISEDRIRCIVAVKASARDLTNLNAEVRFRYNEDTVRWIQVTAHPHSENGYVVWDGFLLDITQRKDSELKLESYRMDLESIVKDRTEELEASNEELYATNEELYATNEEFAVINEELHGKNEQLQQEIATRKQIMQQLEDSENKMRSYVEQSIEGIVILDEEGIITEWNSAMGRITGIPKPEAVGQNSWDIYQKLIPPEDISTEGEKFRNRIWSLLKSKTSDISENSEHQLCASGGGIKYIHMIEFPIGLAEKNYLGQIIRDITEQKMVDMELERYRTQLEDMVASQTRELILSKERLTSLSDNLPGGVIYQITDKGEDQAEFTYISAQFADMFGLNVDDVMADSSLFYTRIHPDDRSPLLEKYRNADRHKNFDIELRIIPDQGKTIWIQMRSSAAFLEDGTRVWDGFMIDITSRKEAEQELEETRKRQNILIKVLQIIQSTDNIPDAIHIALAEMGKYAGVSRSYIFEKTADGRFADNTYEWCDEGITAEIDGLQGVPIEHMQEWFDAFAAGSYVCASDIKTLTPVAYERLSEQGIKSVLVLPLEANGVNYGFVGFDECLQHKEWQQKEVDLLVSLSQIISSTTRRYWAETSMQLSQQTMRTVLDNIDANIYVADFDTYEILFANKKIKEQMGQELEGKKCWQVIHHQEMPCDFCPNPKLLDEHKSPSGLYHWESFNKVQDKWYECTDAAIEWIDGRLVHMEYATDITDRKKAEEALRQSEDMYRQLTEASPDAIIVSTPDGKVTFLSTKAKELFLVEGEEPARLKLYHFVHPHDFRKAFEMFRMFIQDNVVFLPQLLLKRKDGSEFFGEISSASVKDAKGNTTSVIMLIRDITERKMNEMELIRAKEKAEESDKLKSAFLANMSHEIRTPINGIIGFLNFLADENLSPKRRQEYITVVNNSSVQLVKLIDDIIDVAKIEAKQMSLRPVPFRLNEFMVELQVFFETYLQANNKDRIALILDDSLFIESCLLYVDPMRLRQVLTNLIGNAIKFTDKGFIRFGYRQAAPDCLEFVVEDSGIGLAQDQLEVIFERFRQAELSNSRRYGGTGLGLTISRSLVQMMGGNLTVESVEGEGSIFRFTISYLPVKPEEEHIFEENEAEKEKTGNNPGHAFILLAEPEIMKSKYYEKILSDAGVSYMIVHTVKEWIETIMQRNHIDAVLADARIFENEDPETVKQVKSIRAGLPLILLVPEINDDYNRIIRNLPSGEVLEEPADLTKLRRLLKKYE